MADRSLVDSQGQQPATSQMSLWPQPVRIDKHLDWHRWQLASTWGHDAAQQHTQAISSLRGRRDFRHGNGQPPSSPTARGTTRCQQARGVCLFCRISASSSDRESYTTVVMLGTAWSGYELQNEDGRVLRNMSGGLPGRNFSENRGLLPMGHECND